MPTRRSLWQRMFGGGLAIGAFVRSADAASPADGLVADINAEIARLGEAGGLVQLAPRTYEINAPIVLPPGVTIRGAPGQTIVKVMADDISAFAKHGGQQSGESGLHDLTVWGFADRNPTLGKHKLVEVGPFDRFTMTGCRVVHSRHMGITAVAEIATVERCTLNRIHRDAINLTGSSHVRVKDCDIEQAGDDAIAVHASAHLNGIADLSVEVSGNRIAKSFGIKLLGARHTIVTGNRLRFYYGYGIFVGGPDGDEGMAAKFNIVVNGNSLLDGMNGQVVGAGDIGAAIVLLNKATQPQGAAIDASNEESAINRAGKDVPRGADGTVAITGNTIRQTLGAHGHFSDAGFGPLWSNAGEIDPGIQSLVRGLHGIQVMGDWDGVAIGGNPCEGADHAIRFKNFTGLCDIVVSGNPLRRFNLGVAFEAKEARAVRSVLVEGNVLDGDPDCEIADHAPAGNGAWSSTGDQTGSAFLALDVRGVSFARNVIRNVRKVLHAGDIDGQGVFLAGNDYHWDFVAGAGIGLMDQASGRPGLNRHFWADSAPQSASFGAAAQPADSAYVESATAQPELGNFRIGQFVANASPAVQDGRVLRGWLRLTTGNGHEAGTDWAVLTDSVG